jgi:hypothetical protein
MRTLVSTIAVGVALAGTAHALTETFLYAVTPQTAPFTADFTLPGFDTTVGRLLSVELSLTNTSFGPGPVRVPGGLDGMDPDHGLALSVPLTVTGPAGLDLTATVICGSCSSSTATTAIPLGQFGDYESPGGSSVQFDVTAPDAFYPPSQFDFDPVGSAQRSGTFEVTYIYAPSARPPAAPPPRLPPPPGGVPEPATWALMLLGILGLGATLRGRRHAAAA